MTSVASGFSRTVPNRDIGGVRLQPDHDEPVLTIESVSKRFRSGNYGVRDVSLSVDGGVLGLLGPNGAGKTTLMQMIATVTRPTSGRILFNGDDIVARPDELRARLGYLPQDFGVYDNLTAIEFLSYFAALKGVRDARRVREMLEMVNLHAVANRAVGGFSGGMKQRLGIAQALINDPDLVIVDEPTAGLDPGGARPVPQRPLRPRRSASWSSSRRTSSRTSSRSPTPDRDHEGRPSRRARDARSAPARARPVTCGKW